MSQPFLAVANTFRLVTRKHDTVDTTELWTNTWAVTYPPGDSPEEGDEIVDAILNFEGFITYNTVILQDLLVYPWQYGMSGSGPTPPILVVTVDSAGSIPTVNTSPAWQGGGPAGSNVVAHIKLNRTSGPRNGKHFFRGVLEKNDIKATGAGEAWSLSNAGSPTVIDEVIDSYISTHMPPFFAGGSNTQNAHLAIVHAHKSGGVIVSAVAGGVSGMEFAAVAGLQRRQRSGT